MRLSSNEIAVIVTTFRKHFMPESGLWLFGSRVNDEALGGDIDLFIKCGPTETADIMEKKINFLIDLKSKIGDQKIDIVIRPPNVAIELPIYDLAMKTGIRLV